MENKLMTFSEKLEEILGKEITHVWVDNDNWYSCPKAPDGCLNEAEGTECNCGMDKSIDRAKQAIIDLVAGIIINHETPRGHYNRDGFQAYEDCKTAILDKLKQV